MQATFDYAGPPISRICFPIFWKHVEERKLTFNAVYSRETQDPSVKKLFTAGDCITSVLGQLNTKRLGELIVEYNSDTVLYVLEGNNSVTVAVAAYDAEKLAEATAFLNTLYPKLASDESKTRMDFWYMVPHEGPEAYSRSLETPTWESIKDNYNSVVQTEMDRLVTTFKPGLGGRLLYWSGPQGTGKSTAVRSLVREWSSWCDTLCVTDPEVFFNNTSYMMKLFLSEDFLYDPSLAINEPEGKPGTKDRWKLIILEDTGEFVNTAASREGQALSRFLNVCDGFIGQGLKVIVLITSNQDSKDLHPAVTRPGRCSSKLQFSRLTKTEAQAWLDANKVEKKAEKDYSLAELYAELEGFTNKEPEKERRFGL